MRAVQQEGRRRRGPGRQRRARCMARHAHHRPSRRCRRRLGEPLVGPQPEADERSPGRGREDEQGRNQRREGALRAELARLIEEEDRQPDRQCSRRPGTAADRHIHGHRRHHRRHTDEGMRLEPGRARQQRRGQRGHNRNVPRADSRVFTGNREAERREGEVNSVCFASGSPPTQPRRDGERGADRLLQPWRTLQRHEDVLHERNMPRWPPIGRIACAIPSVATSGIRRGGSR
jgi:hypothetical protein